MTRAFISIGSNLPDREQNLRQAIDLVAAHPDIAFIRGSRIYETEPVGGVEQPMFLNAVIEMATGLAPQALLQHLQAVEQRLGRTRHVRWGPRTVDLDILLFGRARLADAQLTVPHPRMSERRFVLVPLAEIAPGVQCPVSGLTARELLENCKDKSRVVLYNPRENTWLSPVERM